MDPITLFALIASAFGGMISGGVRQQQQNQQQRAQVEAERAQREAAAEVAARRREQIQGEIAGVRENLAQTMERIRRGAEYSGLDTGASREATRNMQAAQAAAAMSGAGDSGMAQNQAGAIIADAMASTALARLNDNAQRQGMMAQTQQGAAQLIAQLLQDPAFNVGSGEELTAGFDHLLTTPSPFGSAFAGGLGAVLPMLSLLGQQGIMSQFGQDGAAGAAGAAGTAGAQAPLPLPDFTPMPPIRFGGNSSVNPGVNWSFLDAG